MRVRGVLFEFAPEVADVDPEDVSFRGVGRSPNLPEELLVRQHFAARLHECLEELIFGRGQTNDIAAYLDAPPCQIDLEISVPERLSCAISGQAPQQHPDASEEFSDGERFRQIVVGPRIKRRDLLFFLVADREDEDRGRPLRPEMPRDLDAVAIRQTEVEDDDIRMNGGGRRQGGTGASRFEDCEGLSPQHNAQKTPDRVIIIYDEYADALGTHRDHPMGMRTLTTMPPPSCWAAQIRPLWASTNPLAMVRPSPVPPTRSDVRGSPGGPEPSNT